MRKPPRLATTILMRLARRNESIVGDLFEEYAAGRSRAWFWQQVLSAVIFGAVREIGDHPFRAVGAVATGWAVLLLAFALLGDLTAIGLAKVVWGWDRRLAYGGLQPWWPFQICAALVSYAGFALSAWTVSRLFARHPAMLLAYMMSVIAGLTASAVLLEILARQSGAVAVPHSLFYIVSLTLPYQWRSGFLLVPFVMLLASVYSARWARHESLSAKAR